jgi:hypothetical protein
VYFLVSIPPKRIDPVLDSVLLLVFEIHQIIAESLTQIVQPQAVGRRIDHFSIHQRIRQVGINRSVARFNIGLRVIVSNTHNPNTNCALGGETHLKVLDDRTTDREGILEVIAGNACVIYVGDVELVLSNINESGGG